MIPLLSASPSYIATRDVADFVEASLRSTTVAALRARLVNNRVPTQPAFVAAALARFERTIAGAELANAHRFDGRNRVQTCAYRLCESRIFSRLMSVTSNQIIPCGTRDLDAIVIKGSKRYAIRFTLLTSAFDQLACARKAARAANTSDVIVVSLTTGTSRRFAVAAR